MGKRTMEEMLLLDHEDHALSGKLAQMFMPAGVGGGIDRAGSERIT